MSRRFQGKVVLVTGASRGIGAGIATRFLLEGARVLAVSRTAPGFINDSKWKGRASWQQTDLSETAQIAALFERVDRQFDGKIDVLVNNAGLQIPKNIADTTDDDWSEMTAVNLTAIFQCCRSAVKRMQRNGGGNIINIGSTAGLAADRQLAIYSASKGWLHALTRAIATDHGSESIRCNAVCPSWTMTEMAAIFFRNELDPERAEAGVRRRHPLGRLAFPDEIASACAWLASDEARFVTGQLIFVDGGVSAASPIDPAIDFR